MNNVRSQESFSIHVGISTSDKWNSDVGFVSYAVSKICITLDIESPRCSKLPNPPKCCCEFSNNIRLTPLNSVPPSPIIDCKTTQQKLHFGCSQMFMFDCDMYFDDKQGLPFIHPLASCSECWQPVILQPNQMNGQANK